MLPFDDLINHIEQDNHINQHNLESELVRIPQLSVKYLRYHRQYKEVLIQAWGRQEKLKLEKHVYYSGKAESDVYRANPFNMVIKNQTELSTWINGDDAMVTLQANISLTEDCMEKVEAMLDSLKFRSNHIQTILQIRIFESGA